MCLRLFAGPEAGCIQRRQRHDGAHVQVARDALPINPAYPVEQGLAEPSAAVDQPRRVKYKKLR